MTRVLVLSDLWLPFPGGAERLMFNLARDLDNRPDVVVHVLTGYEQPQAFDGPKVVRANISLDGAGWAYIDAMVVEFRPDVILTHHLYARRFHDDLVALGVPIVEVVLNGQRMPEAALGVFISEYVAAQSGRRPGDMVVTPPAFGDVVAHTHGDAVGFVKPIRHKGVELVYRIAAKMPRRRFLILRGEWQDLELIIPSHNIEFMEPVDDVRDFYARCRLLLMPSVSEDAGTVAQEATLNGLPCVSSDVGGLPETNGGGVLLPPTDVRAWLRAIVALDNPAWYAQVVASQAAHLARLDHQGKLDTLAQRIKELH